MSSWLSCSLRRRTVPGSGNSSPEKTRTTLPRSFRSGFPSEKDSFRGAQAEGGPASASQGDVVARQIDLLEAVVVLEVAQAVSLFFPEAEFRIDQVRDSPCSAGPDRLCDQHIRRSLVPVLDHRQDLHQA